MMSKNSTRPAATSEIIECRRLAGGRFFPADIGVVTERELSIFINGARLATASITPGMEKEFAVGYLFGQGFINALEDVASIEIEASAVKATLKDTGKLSPSSPKASYRIVSGGGRTAYYDETSPREIRSGMKLKKQAIFKAMNALFEKARIYRDTEGVHAAGLFTANAESVCIVEDIGRHNTLDKTIGYALVNNIDCSNTFVVSTGRMASEMVAKICRAGIPVAATKTAVTDKGLETGKKCGLTLIGFVRDTGTRINTDMEVRVIKEAGMKIYSRPERVLWE
jgi:FdhD protein